MLSLDKTKDLSVIKNFLGKKSFVAMAKMDGLTCSLTYEKGKLVRAETRGNGTIGEDILHNANVIPSIPKYINYPVIAIASNLNMVNQSMYRFKVKFPNILKSFDDFKPTIRIGSLSFYLFHFVRNILTFF